MLQAISMYVKLYLEALYVYINGVDSWKVLI